MLLLLLLLLMLLLRLRRQRLEPARPQELEGRCAGRRGGRHCRDDCQRCGYDSAQADAAQANAAPSASSSCCC